jgi:hypothetical protein
MLEFLTLCLTKDLQPQKVVESMVEKFLVKEIIVENSGGEKSGGEKCGVEMSVIALENPSSSGKKT